MEPSRPLSIDKATRFHNCALPHQPLKSDRAVLPPVENDGHHHDLLLLHEIHHHHGLHHENHDHALDQTFSLSLVAAAGLDFRIVNCPPHNLRANHSTKHTYPATMSSSSNNNNNNKSKERNSSSSSSSSTHKSKKRPRREVLVVTCPTDDYGSFRRREPPPSAADDEVEGRRRQQKRPKTAAKTKNSLLDWHKTAQEIRSLGATALSGHDKRAYEAEQYEKLTGRKRKGQKMPLPMLRAIRKKQQASEAKRVAEARESGVVLANKSTQQQPQQRRRQRTSDVFGPAPSIGFMTKGVYRVKSSQDKAR